MFMMQRMAVAMGIAGKREWSRGDELAVPTGGRGEMSGRVSTGGVKLIRPCGLLDCGPRRLEPDSECRLLEAWEISPLAPRVWNRQAACTIPRGPEPVASHT